MGGAGADVALETAGTVLMSDELGKLPTPAWISLLTREKRPVRRRDQGPGIAYEGRKDGPRDDLGKRMPGRRTASRLQEPVAAGALVAGPTVLADEGNEADRRDALAREFAPPADPAFQHLPLARANR